jgi:tripartite-type tricarboxylate transporter receptor subunit TctC
MKTRTILSLITSLLFVFFIGFAGAAGPNYPNKEITYTIPFNPGGETDIEFRVMQNYLEKAFGVRFIPDYKPAAGGALAWSFMAAAKPDGYNLGGFNIPHIILQPWSLKDAKFSTRDFAYLTMIEYTPIGLAVKKDFPAKTLKEFIDYAKANPNKVTVGIVGKYSGHHLAALQFMKLTGTTLTLVPFQGTGTQKPAIMGGHVDAVFSNSPALVEMKPAGVTPLAIGTETRMKQLPEVPTFVEAGVKYYPRIDRGILAPKDLPKEILEKLDKTLYDVVRNKEVQSKLVEAGFVPNPLNMGATQKYVEEQLIDIKKLLEEENLMPAK